MNKTSKYFWELHKATFLVNSMIVLTVISGIKINMNILVIGIIIQLLMLFGQIAFLEK